MSRKDYVAIAKAFAAARATLKSEEPSVTYEIAKDVALDYAILELARVFEADNPKFDSEKFLLAAGAR